MLMHKKQVGVISKLGSISIPELWDAPGMAYLRQSNQCPKEARPNTGTLRPHCKITVSRCCARPLLVGTQANPPNLLK